MSPEVDKMNDILRNNGRWDGKGFSEAETHLLSKYYELVLKWNKRLHLTTLTRPQEFFERHILESAFSESLILPSVNQVWDLGSGLGVPGMVIAILRPDLNARLVEVSRNKTLFLEEAAAHLNLKNVKVVESRFEAIEGVPEESCLTVRAIERMEKMIPEILRLGAKASQILISGPKNIEEKARSLINDQRKILSLRIPGSNRRYLINIFRST
ncbi:MAG TPA: 16S rRNA (guanine(527)-N(7))-methyltransferase RsmG [Blastocatellia bacterium]|nr:16S rRNA (guanine(527)-N(7))-methyltransferase RsmG [Blastocatellia bacterium]